MTPEPEERTAARPDVLKLIRDLADATEKMPGKMVSCSSAALRSLADALTTQIEELVRDATDLEIDRRYQQDRARAAEAQLAERDKRIEEQKSYLLEREAFWFGKAVTAEQRVEELERERDIAREVVDDFTKNYVALEAQLAERDKRIEELGGALKGVAWKDSAGLCWCQGETEFAVAHPNADHTPRCLAARAALAADPGWQVQEC